VKDGNDVRDPLGDRLKSSYEAATQLELPRKTYTIIRLDGKSFHAYTRNLPRPFDPTLHEDLVAATSFLCSQVTNALLAYVQSDEVSLLLADTAKPTTQPWLGGNVQKITSISASILTAKFNDCRNLGIGDVGEMLAFFDSRVFTIDEPDDVVAYFQWRYLDAWRNGISSLARVHFSPKQLHGKTTTDRREMLYTVGVDYLKQDPRFKCGSVVEPVVRESTVTYRDTKTGEDRTIEGVRRRSWETRPAPQLEEAAGGQGGFLRFGALVRAKLATTDTPVNPVASVALDATPGVATRPDPS
jgi:tRNA(His) guanylyltransferase